MRTRPLGRTGLLVSELGFGAWGIGGVSEGVLSYGPVDDAQSRDALRRAFELGVVFYDTAELYGRGHSEELIGSVFKRERRRVVIASKVGLLRSDGSEDFSPQGLRKTLEGSLQRLQTDYLDVLQLHNPSVELLSGGDEIWETLKALKQSGKVRAIGVSVRTPDEALLAVRRAACETIQVNFNMLDQRILEHGLLERCEREGIGVIARTPLCCGFLTGKYGADAAFDPQDHRSRWPAEQRMVWAQANRILAEALSHPGQTEAQFALRFCLSYPAISVVIPGMLTRAHVEEDVMASGLGPLTEEERRTIEQVYQRHTFFLGSVSESRVAR